MAILGYDFFVHLAPESLIDWKNERGCCDAHHALSEDVSAGDPCGCTPHQRSAKLCC